MLLCKYSDFNKAEAHATPVDMLCVAVIMVYQVLSQSLQI
jgi:hypothetical protein